MKNIVKEDTAEGLKCRLIQPNSGEHLQFPQIQNISDSTLRSNLNTAIKNLNLEHVDLGLFGLGRIFEAELKTFLQLARDKKVFTVTSKDLEKLASMIDCLERNKIISEKHVLTFGN